MRWQGRHLAVEVLFSRVGLATQILLQAENSRLLIDCGDGTVRDLIARGIPPQELAGVLLTHGHTDHMGGLWPLLGFLRAAGHVRPLTVWYPEGCREVEALVAAFQECYSESLPYEIRGVPLADGGRVHHGELEVLARAVRHWHSIRGRLLGPAPALGYRITFRGETVAISGDTAPCPALVDLVRDADLALIEATLGEDAPLDQRTHLHLTTTAAHDLARLAHRAWFIHTPVGAPETPGSCAVRRPDV